MYTNKTNQLTKKKAICHFIPEMFICYKIAFIFIFIFKSTGPKVSASDPKMRLSDVVLILKQKYLNFILTVLGKLLKVIH